MKEDYEKVKVILTKVEELKDKNYKELENLCNELNNLPLQIFDGDPIREDLIKYTHILEGLSLYMSPFTRESIAEFSQRDILLKILDGKN